MSFGRRVLCGIALCAMVFGWGCSRAEDWSDTRYIQRQLEVGNERAFQEFTRLSDAQKAELVPTLIELYDRNFSRDQAIQALIGARDSRARNTFVAALEGSDLQAGMAARGLAALGDTSAAVLIAQRMTRITTPASYETFMEALREIPAAQAADVVAEHLMRRAEGIGGIQTVRQGCLLLGDIADPSDTVIDALVFGLVNFIPAPYQDALNECEYALVRHGDRGVTALLRVLNGENEAVLDRLRNIGYRPVVGQLRAVSVLSKLRSDRGNEGIIAWFSEDKGNPMAELSRLSVDEQLSWYDLHGQLFTQATKALAVRGTAEDQAVLRALEDIETEGSLMDNFRGWFALSDGAEFGLRTPVHEALALAGTDEDRDLLWQRATNGTVRRGGGVMARQLRGNALHYLGRTARAGEMERYETAFEAQSERDQPAFMAHRGYFQLVDTCGDDIGCYSAAIANPSEFMASADVQAVLALFEDDPASLAVVVSQFESAFRVGSVWALALRFGDNLEATGVLFDQLGVPSVETRSNIADALMYISAIPGDAHEKINAFIESDLNNRGDVARLYRHQLRVIKLFHNMPQ